MSVKFISFFIILTLIFSNYIPVTFAQDLIKCPACGYSNPYSAKFCASCGKNLSGYIQRKSYPEQREAPSDKTLEKIRMAGDDLKRFSTLYYAGLGCYVGGLLLIAAGSGSSSGSVATAVAGTIIMITGNVLQLIAPSAVGAAGEKLKEVKKDSKINIVLTDNNNKPEDSSYLSFYTYKF